MRCTLKLKNGKYPINESVENYINKEKEAGFYNGKFIQKYSDKISSSKETFKKEIESMV